MGRRSRGSILYDGCYAHVFSRASEKREIFLGAKDFVKFKELLKEAKKNYSYRIHHYCLMHTHFRLVVSMDYAKEFSEGLKWVKWNYARYFNLREKRFGPLWRDRFKSLIIENERYLQACGKYVEENTVEAGMVERCEDWPYSSSRYYFCNERDDLVDSYRFDGEPIKVENKDEEFTKGYSIGSKLFKIYCKEEAEQGMPVPA